jgi:hypothetical protein
LNERLFSQDLPYLGAVLDPLIDRLAVGILESIDIGTVGGLNIVESLNRSSRDFIGSSQMCL